MVIIILVLANGNMCLYASNQTLNRELLLPLNVSFLILEGISLRKATVLECT